VEVIAGTVGGITVKPVPGYKTGISGGGYAGKNHAQNKNQSSQTNQFFTHNNPPSK
jgi:hypothetical protein